MRFSAPARAWVRDVSPSYADCIRTGALPIDVAKAREQHAAYVRALELAAVEVTRVPADPAAPDCCFIEDTAVLWGGGAILTRPGAPAREIEVPPVGRALRAAGLRLFEMAAPARLDGGDVLRLGERLVVGLSGRTNRAGAEALAAAADLELVAVSVCEGLHLKSAVTSLDEETVVVAAGGAVDTAALRGLGMDVAVVSEHGGNVLALGARVLVSAQAPDVAELAARRGLEPVVLDVSELHKGDGALTCLSLRLPAPGTWCA